MQINKLNILLLVTNFKEPNASYALVGSGGVIVNGSNKVSYNLCLQLFFLHIN